MSSAEEAARQHHQAVFLLGPWLVGGCVDIFLQGVLTCQLFNYFSWYREDVRLLRIYVAGLAVLSIAKTAQAFAIIWIQSILFINDVDGAVLLNYTTWWQSGNPLIVATYELYVQAYFCYRLYVISKRWIVVAPIGTVFVFAFFSMVLATYYITVGVTASPSIAAWFAAHLSSVFAADVLMSCTTAFFLIRSKKNVLPQTVGLISALVRLTFQTAAPAAVCAFFNLVFSQIYVGNDKLISTAFNQALPKIYSVSVLWTLNARRTIRASHSSNGGRGVSSSNEISGGGGRSRRTRANTDVELGNFGGIQVHTAQETVQHIDFARSPGSETKSGGGPGTPPSHDASHLDLEYKR
ncbi:hypothetical protein B0H15DRAFT_799026 [Mycena belliarum]|uniref:DUF6534 domain-containing protein n=1 Tax=Mycena belliarum TaxID=1033014 RepID=A0AAD6XUM9_9AGAR|nr:hypothetical protein B0H15DRAFT_799026 [Mycena belliae]